MKALVMISAVLMLVSAASNAKQFYIIEKVNKGTHFLKPGQESAGFLNNNEVCGAQGGDMPGAEACAVVTPVGRVSGQQLYTLKKDVLVTGTPDKNLVGFIEGSIEPGTGIGGSKGTGVFKFERHQKRHKK